MILVAGSANLDFVVRAGHIPAPGETVLGRDFRTFPGGKGANQAIACARAGGVATHLLVALGTDPFAAPIEASLAEAGVQAHVVRSATQPTGTAFICVSDDAENAITVAPGANATLAPEHLPALRGYSHLLLQLETPLPAVLAFARAARANGTAVVLNAAPAQELPTELLALVDLLVVNQGELATLARHPGGVGECLARLQESGGPAQVVVTLGSRGCVARVGGALLAQPGFRVAAVDTTAAGDTFCGALVSSLSRGSHWPEALREACAAAALACTVAGAQASIPARAAVLQLLQDPAQAQAPGEAAALLRTAGLLPTAPP